MAKESSKIVLNALAKLISPLVRICLRHSLKYQDFIEVLKRTFVEIAEEELKRQAIDANISKISAITGIQRREVSLIYNSKELKVEPSSVLTRVISQWRNDPRFSLASGKPRVLAIGSKQSEFSDLVQSVSKDLNPYTILFELKRLSYVEKTEKGLKLIARFHSTVKNPEESLKGLSRDMRDLLEAVEENIFSGEGIRNLHLRTEYDGIPDENIEEIKKWLLSEGTLFHEKVSAYLSQFDQDFNPSVNKSNRNRVVLGSFSWSELLKMN
jgi:hypothetical protein